ncbi:deoxyguanosinetriphosphate triphosphohydrolase [Curvivirga sp.]|uniref:deoxyguanosinetriphosphate triphosphohydrolase n=1 Tax=Curvivirga sp. TaxID=2856848 RepID=UPI003B5BA90C
MNFELAPYATKWQETRGRLHPENESSMRSPFQRDRDRIVHSAAFRRLMHKTQVFISPEGDHFRTRLTHSLEVAQIARAIARALNVDEDLTEAISLAHDLGHTPFGHSGEDTLHDLMEPYEGFDHNDQALRVLILLESKYMDYKGLNLTWETLEGVVKHNGPLLDGNKTVNQLPKTLASYNQRHDLELDTHSGIEAQIAAIADDVAYNHHDMDDGLRASLFSIKDVCAEVDHVREAFNNVYREYPDAPDHLARAEVVRSLIGEMVEDVLAETNRRLEEDKPKNAKELRHLRRPMVAFSDEMRQKERALKTFMFKAMYRAPSVNQERVRASQQMTELFNYYMEKPDLLPEEWKDQCSGLLAQENARIIADYIAGMTDRFALKLHQRLFEAA